MAALETQEVRTPQLNKSVWMEDAYEHAQRLHDLGEKHPSVWDKTDATPEEKALARIHCPHELEKARACLEYAAHSQHGTPTRMKRPRWDVEWGKAGVPTDHTSFYQDARLTLVIRFDEILRQFVPMTEAEYLAEYEEHRARHANTDAQNSIASWAKWVPNFADNRSRGRYLATPAVEPVLYKRGTHDDIYKMIDHKGTPGLKHQRKNLAKDEWGTDKATLVQNPTFDAFQTKDGQRRIVVRMFDGNKFVDAWEDDGGPTNDVITLTDGNLIAFRKVTPDLYAAHMGQPYVKPGSAEEYAWADPITNPICEFSADAATLVKALGHATVAASDDMTRPILCGVFLEHEYDRINIVSTDTYRLLLQTVEVTKQYGNIPNVILPAKFCYLVARAMRKPVGTLHIRIGTNPTNEHEYIVEISGTNQGKGNELKTLNFLTRNIEGQFINYRKVMPSSFQHEIVFDCPELTKALKELLPVAREDANRVVLQADKQGTTLSASNTATTEGQYAEAKLPAPCQDGDGCEIAFNARYVLDFIEKQNGEVRMELSGPLNSFAWRPTESPHTVGVQMPMQIM